MKVFLFHFILLTACVAWAQRVTVPGVVTDVNKIPIDNAVVSFYVNGTLKQQFTTGSDGKFSAQLKLNVYYELRVKAIGFDELSTPLQFSYVPELLPPLAIELPAEKMELKGRVTDRLSGKAVPYLALQLRDYLHDETSYTHTDVSGYFAFEIQPQKNYELALDARANLNAAVRLTPLVFSTIGMPANKSLVKNVDVYVEDEKLLAQLKTDGYKVGENTAVVMNNVVAQNDTAQQTPDANEKTDKQQKKNIIDTSYYVISEPIEPVEKHIQHKEEQAETVVIETKTKRTVDEKSKDDFKQTQQVLLPYDVVRSDRKQKEPGAEPKRTGRSDVLYDYVPEPKVKHEAVKTNGANTLVNTSDYNLVERNEFILLEKKNIQTAPGTDLPAAPDSIATDITDEQVYTDNLPVAEDTTAFEAPVPLDVKTTAIYLDTIEAVELPVTTEPIAADSVHDLSLIPMEPLVSDTMAETNAGSMTTEQTTITSETSVTQVAQPQFTTRQQIFDELKTDRDEVYSPVWENSIYYRVGKAFLSKDAMDFLDKMILQADVTAAVKMVINVYTDGYLEKPVEDYLSKLRLKQVVDYLMQKSVPFEMLDVHVIGNRYAPNGCTGNVECTQEQHQENRRVEVVLN